MSCCGGTEEEAYTQPSSQSTAQPNRNNPHGMSIFFFLLLLLHLRPFSRDPYHLPPSGDYRDSRGPSAAARGGAPQKVLPIETPAISLHELDRLTFNFGQKALVGEGSYGRVFHATLSTGQPAAIKRLDPSVSQESDSEFSAQVVTIAVIIILVVVGVVILLFFLFLLRRFIQNKATEMTHCAQLSMVSRLKNEYFVELLGYCLEENNRILVYQFATKGSLHDVLHGMPDGGEDPSAPASSSRD